MIQTPSLEERADRFRLLGGAAALRRDGLCHGVYEHIVCMYVYMCVCLDEPEVLGSEASTSSVRMSFGPIGCQIGWGTD